MHDPAAQTEYLLGLDILPEYSGQGLAQELLRLYGIWSQVRGRHWMVLTAHEEKVGMYEKLGFTDLGISGSVWGGTRGMESGWTGDLARDGVQAEAITGPGDKRQNIEGDNSITWNRKQL